MYNIEQLKELCKLNMVKMIGDDTLLKTSTTESINEFKDWISEIIEIEQNESIISIPTINIAISFSDNNTGSELHGVLRSDRLSKTNEFANRGIRLIHIYENEWIVKNDIVKSRVSSLLGKNNRIYARKCEIVLLSSKEYVDFFNVAHIQGSASASICYGLKYNGELVAALSLGKSRFDKQVEYELIRYSNALNTNVVGGASKLFQHFIKVYNPNSIISYSDKRWNTGNLYKQLGFVYTHSANPNYFYFHKSNPLSLQSRQTFQKHKLQSKLKTFNPLLTEWQNMVNNGYDRIWDCGNSVWVWNNPTI